MIPYIIMMISLLLDGLLTNYLPYLVNELSIFTPMLTVISIICIYPFYQKQEKKYYLTIFILGMIYDLMYTNLLFWNGILFLILAIIVRFIYKNYEVTPIRLILYSIIIITIYETLTGIILFTFQLVPVTISKVFYKITHSLILNIIYIEIVYGIIKRIPKRFKKISIN